MSNWELEIDKVNNDRRNIMNNFLKTSSEQLLILDRWKGKETTAINTKDFRAFQMHKWIVLNPKVRFMLIEDSGEELVFITEMKKGGEFGWHRHDDCTETCIIEKGHVYCLETKREAEEGEELFYDLKEPHIPIALKDSKFTVIFKQINNE